MNHIENKTIPFIHNGPIPSIIPDDGKKYYVLGFMFDATKDRVVLIRKNRPDSQRGKLNGIGGKVEHTDPGFEYAMSREFLEETGVETKPWDWIKFNVMRGESWHVTCYYCISQNYKDVKSMTDETVQVVLTDHVNNMEIMSNLRWLIPMAQEGNVLCADTIYYI